MNALDILSRHGFKLVVDNAPEGSGHAGLMPLLCRFIHENGTVETVVSIERGASADADLLLGVIAADIMDMESDPDPSAWHEKIGGDAEAAEFKRRNVEALQSDFVVVGGGEFISSLIDYVEFMRQGEDDEDEDLEDIEDIED